MFEVSTCDTGKLVLAAVQRHKLNGRLYNQNNVLHSGLHFILVYFDSGPGDSQNYVQLSCQMLTEIQ